MHLITLSKLHLCTFLYISHHPPKNRRRNKEKIHQVQFVLPTYSVEHGQTPSGQHLKDN